MGIKENIANLLLDINAVEISITKPFRYASGIYSPIYTNCRILTLFPEQISRVIDSMVERIIQYKNKIDVVMATGTSSIFLTSLISQRLKCPMAYVRSSRKDHGKKKKIEGVFKAGDKTLLVSDIISTERDVLNSIDVVRKSGGTVLHCLAIFSNNIGILESKLKNENIPYSVLTDIDTVLEIAIRKKKFSQDEIKTILEWQKNPIKWNQKKNIIIAKRILSNKKRIAEILLEIGAVSINVDKPFLYASGIQSPIYTDIRLLMSAPDKWNVVIDAFVEIIINKIGLNNFDIIAGTATSGIPHATLIADRLGLPMVYVKVEKETQNGQIIGDFNKGSRLIMIEDHVTTGKSVLSAASALKKKGGIVEWCVAIFTYDIMRSKQRFEEENINIITLCDLNILIKTATEKKLITLNEKNSVYNWLNNPEFWVYQ